MGIFETLSTHWHVIASLAVLIAGGVALYLATKFVRHERCREHREAMEKAQAEALANLPNIKAMHKMELQMSTLEGSIKTFEAKLDGYNRALSSMERMAHTMDNFLREHGVKK